MRDPDADRLLASLPETERYAAWHLARPDGTIVGRGAGAVDVLSVVRRTRPLGRALGLLPPRLLDGGYGLLADRRSTLGHVVPDGPAPRRFP